MSLFKPKSALNSRTMTSLIYENAKHRTGEVTPLFDKLGVLYDELENQLIVMAINYELAHWELAKTNSKDKIEKIINDVYDRFFSSLRIGANEIEEYRNIMNQSRRQMDDILFPIKNQFAPKPTLTYNFLLEAQNISKELVDRITEQEILFTIEGWFNLAKQMNDNYKIVDTKADEKNDKHIDFDF